MKFEKSIRVVVRPLRNEISFKRSRASKGWEKNVFNERKFSMKEGSFQWMLYGIILKYVWIWILISCSLILSITNLFWFKVHELKNEAYNMLKSPWTKAPLPKWMNVWHMNSLGRCHITDVLFLRECLQRKKFPHL